MAYGRRGRGMPPQNRGRRGGRKAAPGYEPSPRPGCSGLTGIAKIRCEAEKKEIASIAVAQREKDTAAAGLGRRRGGRRGRRRRF